MALSSQEALALAAGAAESSAPPPRKTNVNDALGQLVTQQQNMLVALMKQHKTDMT